MKRSGGGAAALLAKVNNQLKGDFTHKEDEDDVGAYFSALSKKNQDKGKKAEIQWDKFGQDDLSMSDEDIKINSARSPSPKVNRFLKKKPTEDASQGKGSKFMKKTPATTNKTSALNKVASYSTTKYDTKIPTAIEMSDSDIDMDLSLDEDVLADVSKLKTAAPVIPKAKPTPFVKPKSPDISSSSEIGKGGNRFMKKKKKSKSPSPRSLKSPKSKQSKSSASESLFKAQTLDADAPEISEDESSMDFTMEDGELVRKTKHGTLPSQPALYRMDSDDSLGKGGNRFMKKKPTTQTKLTIVEDGDDRAKGSSSRKPKKDQFTLKSSEKYSTTLMLDSDDESMQKYIGDLSPATSPRKSPRTPKGILKTPRSPRAPSMEQISEIEEHKHKDSDEDFQANVFDLDDLQPAENSIEFEKPKPKTVSTTKSKKKSPATDIMSSFGVFSVDDLLGKASDNDESVMSEVMTAGVSEVIKTDIEDSDMDVGVAKKPLRSILAQSPRPVTPRSSRSRVRLSLSNLNRSRSPSPEVISTARTSHRTGYSDDFEDESIKTETYKTETIRTEPIHTASIHTESVNSDSDVTDFTDNTETDSVYSYPSGRRRTRSETDDYSDDFTSATEGSVRRGRRYSRGSDYDSEYSTFSDYSAYSTDTNRSYRRKKSVKTKNMTVQTGLDLGDLQYHWNTDKMGETVVGPYIGLDKVDPTPVAAHVVSADALEAMTSYSPSVLALNDMLRQQLQLTQGFIDMQKQFHQSFMTSLTPDYNYTTLDDTKRYIKKHKKPVISFKEALKQVKEDMGLS